MIEIILEDLNNKSPMATNINIQKLYEMYKEYNYKCYRQTDRKDDNDE